VSQPTVVNKIQQLQRLETVVYTMDKVVSGEKENPFLPNFLAGDRLLMVVHGEVVAGVDFSGLKSGDVAVDERKVLLRLPLAQVFSTRIDNGDAGAPGSGEADAAGGAPGWDSEDRKHECPHYVDESAAGVGV
jgi:hypothetical protein